MTTDNEQARARTAQRIAAVRARFLAGLGDRLAQLAEAAHAASGPDAAAAAAAGDSLRLGLHNLAGASPTLGLLELGRRAAQLEKRVIASRVAGGGLPSDASGELVRDILALVESRD
ncbi:Hpt domain-containing protein [Hansschlegelia zhihuaiae]|nr:Hpt domain-containing protein [Hansschlegelia zhihuaiae]